MSKTAKNNSRTNVPFCGLRALISHLKKLAIKTTDPQTFDEIYEAVEELYRLDDCLANLRYERAFVDEHDIDQAIDRLRRGVEGGA